MKEKYITLQNFSNLEPLQCHDSFAVDKSLRITNMKEQDKKNYQDNDDEFYLDEGFEKDDSTLSM